MSDPERSLDNLPRSSLLHIPRQQRSARRVHDILDAGVRVLLAEGSQAFNTNRIADAADVPVGSVYQYFPHKQAILGGIIERGLLDSEQLLRSIAQQGLGRPIEEVVDQGLRALVMLLLPHRALICELFREATPFGGGSVLAPIEETLTAVSRDWLAANATTELEHDPATLHVALGGGIFVFLRWIIEQPEAVPFEDFIAALTTQSTAGIRSR